MDVGNCQYRHGFADRCRGMDAWECNSKKIMGVFCMTVGSRKPKAATAPYLPNRSLSGLARGLVALMAGISLCLPHTGMARAEEFKTDDPLKAFVHEEYARGDDYFINGNENTYLFRCVLTKELEPFEGVALSEISIWGNHTGPWEVFRKEPNGGFVYVKTRHYASTSCLESCRSNEYLLSGQCTWRRDWPKQP